MAKTRRRLSRKSYLKLTFGAVILVGLNYVFTKMFDLFFGNFNTAALTIDMAFFFLFIAFFTFYLRWADIDGSIARMLGAKDED